MYDSFGVSVITELELLSKSGLTPAEVEAVNEFLATCLIVELTTAVKDKTIVLRQQHKIKLPDAIVAASAQWLKVPLLTADKGFKKVSGLDLILLELPGE